ncbi:unnamed protein product, partial [Didymodactylos carnosus]
ILVVAVVSAKGIMSYCVSKGKEGKDKVIFLTESDLNVPSKIKQKNEEAFDPWEQHGLILPNGNINFDCPCLGGMASGPCGNAFRKAFTCFHYSDAKPKGSECFGDFQNLTECFSKYPKLYASNKEKNNNTKNEEHDSTSATTAIANALSAK